MPQLLGGEIKVSKHIQLRNVWRCTYHLAFVFLSGFTQVQPFICLLWVKFTGKPVTLVTDSFPCKRHFCSLIWVFSFDFITRVLFTCSLQKTDCWCFGMLQSYTCYLLCTWHFLSEMPPHCVFIILFHVVVVAKLESHIYFCLIFLWSRHDPQWIKTSIIKGSKAVWFSWDSDTEGCSSLSPRQWKARDMLLLFTVKTLDR